jgi:hypothetical protein
MVRLKNFPSYYINELGQIFSNKTNKIIKGSPSVTGYSRIFLYKNKRRHDKYVHRLVWQTFRGDVGTLEINHINGIKSDNRLNNLELVTHRENLQHAYDSGLHSSKGETHYNTKLTNHKVKVIKELLLPIFNYTEIGKMYGVNGRVIGKIARGETWRHI